MYRISTPPFIVEHGVEILSRVFIGSLPYNTNESELKTFFEQYGEIAQCNIVSDRKTGLSKGYGFITFRKEADARNLLKMESLNFKNKTINISRAIRKAAGKGQYDKDNREYQLAKSTSVSIVNCNGRDYLVQADGKWQLLKNKGQPGIMLYSAVIPPPPQPLLCIMPQSPVITPNTYHPQLFLPYH